MNTPTDNAEPLDPNERELARVLRALPGGEPPAALDARILKAASDAVAVPTPRRKRALWAAGGSTGALWGIGSAAAAVLAIGIAWQVNTPPDSGIPVPRTLPTAADEPSDEATTVDFVPMPEREYDNSGPPPSPPPPPETQRRRDVQAAPQREQAKPSAPAPAMEPYIDEHVETRQAAKAQAGADVGFAASPPAPATAAPSPAASDAASAGMLARDRAEAAAAAEAPAESEQLDSIVVSGTRIQKESPGDARARVFNDRLLEPDPWLARIRERWTDDDRDGARASLRLFVERHPDRSIPTDLRPLLEE